MNQAVGWFDWRKSDRARKHNVVRNSWDWTKGTLLHPQSKSVASNQNINSYLARNKKTSKIICSCGFREEEVKCQGKPYAIHHKLTCSFHIQEFTRECEARDAIAEYVINQEIGVGHSNLPESFFSVLQTFRSKTVSLQQKGYEGSSFLGLLQANPGSGNILSGLNYMFLQIWFFEKINWKEKIFTLHPNWWEVQTYRLLLKMS